MKRVLLFARLSRAALAELFAGVMLLALAFFGLTAFSPAAIEPTPGRPSFNTRTQVQRLPATTESFTRRSKRLPLSYRLQAKLNEKKKEIQGSGEIRFTNTSSGVLTELWFHLYLNAFKNSRTLFARSPFSAGRGGEKAAQFGHIEVTELKDLRSGIDLWAGRAPHSPGDPEDETDIQVPLETPLGPGETITLEVRWLSKLPQIVERTGYSQDYFFVAQWFPKLAKFVHDDGSGRAGFRHFAFHPHAEFYADFADYWVTLDVPERDHVGATGELVAQQHDDGRKELRYEALRVHDFAWTAWNGFEVYEEQLDGLRMRLLYPPDHDLNREKTLEALRFAVPHFENLYGEYPYSTLTVVHPPAHAANSGGMEYPTLITTGGSWKVSLYSRAVELVTIHELAHQWFYGLIASDEPRWPFLDEGFASYAEAKAIEALYGPGSAASVLGITLSADALRRASAAEHGLDAPVALAAAEFPGFNYLGALAYNRTATLFETYENLHGAAFVDLLRAYATRFRFDHPEPEDFFRLAAEHIGLKPTAQLEKALFERAFVDYAIESVRTAKAIGREGLFGEGAAQHSISPEPGSAGPAEYLGQVLLVRRGNLEFPVQVTLYDSEGGTQQVEWDGTGAFTIIPYSGEYPLVGAVVDPQRKITIDQNLLNQSYFTSKGPPLRTLERTTYYAQLLLHLVGP